jgi:aurora kinase
MTEGILGPGEVNTLASNNIDTSSGRTEHQEPEVSSQLYIADSMTLILGKGASLPVASLELSQRIDQMAPLDTTSQDPEAPNTPGQIASIDASSHSPTPPPEPTVFQLDMFELGEPTDVKFAHRYLARDRRSGISYTLDRYNKKMNTQMRHLEQIQRQLDIRSSLQHDNILKMLGHFEDQKDIYMVLEFVSEETMYERLQRENRFSEGEAARYIAQVVEGLKYIHGEHVIHRDLKPENLVRDVNGAVKFLGFEWSVRAPPSHNKRRSLCGTLDYLPPEMLKPAEHLPSGIMLREYTNKIDLWSLGVLVYEFLVGEAPFADTPAMTQKKISTADMTVPEFVSEEAKDLITRVSRLVSETGDVFF